MQTAVARPGPTVRLGSQLMRDELSHALFEAIYELEVLPRDEDGAFLGLYAVMDDLTAAIHRTESIDPARCA